MYFNKYKIGSLKKKNLSEARTEKCFSFTIVSRIVFSNKLKVVGILRKLTFLKLSLLQKLYGKNRRKL